MANFHVPGMLRRGVEALEAYVPGRSIEEVAREFGVSDVVKLASNENALGPSPVALAALQGALAGLHRYPDGGAVALREGLAAKLGVSSERIIAGNGGDDILSILARTFLNEGEEAIVPAPTFSPYAHVTKVMGGAVVASPLRDFRIDLEDIRAKFTSRTKLIFLCSPNNPTGGILTEDELVPFLEDVPGGALVLLDEAYGDFVEAPGWPDSVSLTDRFPLIVLRSFSKIYGLAGLRVGYGVGPGEMIGYMQRVREPFNVNQLAQVAALAALDDEAFRRESVELVKSGRRHLYRSFEELKLAYLESQANFIFVRVGDADVVTRRLMERGVIVRPGSAFGCPEWVRVTVGLEAENERLIRALKEVIPR